MLLIVLMFQITQIYLINILYIQTGYTCMYIIRQESLQALRQLETASYTVPAVCGV